MKYLKIFFGRNIIPTMQIAHENFSSRSLNLETPNVVKTPKPHSVTNYQKWFLNIKWFLKFFKNKVSH